jgi:S-adenosylmethionine decarboxylase
VLKMALGYHIIAEFYGVPSHLIERADTVKRILDRAIAKSKLKRISSHFYQFKPFGVTCVYLLRESHISIHTWPEYSYVALDLFTCGSKDKLEVCFKALIASFSPKKVIKKLIKRGENYESLPRKHIVPA